MNSRRAPRPTRIEDLIAWLAASLVVTAGVVYVLNEHEKSRRRPRATRSVPRATPAQEPLILQDKRASEPRPRPPRAFALADSLAGMEGHSGPHL